MPKFQHFSIVSLLKYTINLLKKMMKALFLLKFLPYIFMISLWGNPEQMVQEANLSVKQAEKANTYQGRNQAYNTALSLYSLIERTIKPSPASIERAIGDIYFQFGEYSWAILYYERALKKDPHDSLATSHLKKIQSKLGLEGLDDSSSHLYWHDFKHIFLKLSQNYFLFFSIFLLSFLACSLSIWVPFKKIRKMVFCSFLLLLLFISNSLFFYYFTPLEGILVTSSGFYSSPNENQPQITSHPLPAGLKVKVLQITSMDEWLKVTTSAGLVGYIPTSNLRLI